MAIITMPDGSKIHACVKTGQVLTPEDERVIAEYIQFVRDRKAKLKAKLDKRQK